MKELNRKSIWNLTSNKGSFTSWKRVTRRYLFLKSFPNLNYRSNYRSHTIIFTKSKEAMKTTGKFWLSFINIQKGNITILLLHSVLAINCSSFSKFARILRTRSLRIILKCWLSSSRSLNSRWKGRMMMLRRKWKC